MLSQTVELQIVIEDDDENTNHFAIAGWERGSIHLPAAITGTSLDIEVTNLEDSSGIPTKWNKVVTVANAAITVLTVGVDDAIPLTSEVFSFKYIRFQMDAQAADRTLTLHVSTSAR